MKCKILKKKEIWSLFLFSYFASIHNYVCFISKVSNISLYWVQNQFYNQCIEFSLPECTTITSQTRASALRGVTVIVHDGRFCKGRAEYRSISWLVNAVDNS